MSEAKTKRPRSEETIKVQIYGHALRYLIELANKEFAVTGEYVAPTEEQIRTECKKRWQKHLDLHADKKDVSMFF